MFFRLPFILLNRDGAICDARLTEISWTRKERWLAYKAETPDWGDKPLMIAPDLAVNVLPRDSSVLDTDRKFERGLRNGVRMIWIVDSKLKTVTVRCPDFHAKLGINHTLTGGDIISGFAIPEGHYRVR